MTAQPPWARSFATVDFPAPLGPTSPTVRQGRGRRTRKAAARMSRLYTASPTPRLAGMRA